MDLSVFGKLCTQADFFRHGHAGPAVREAERWLLEAFEALRGADLDLPDTAVHILLSSSHSADVVAIIAVASHDSVGRSFPLALFAPVDAGLVAGRGWLLPVVCERFFDAAKGALVRAARSGDADRLVSELDRLPPIDAATFRIAETIVGKLIDAQSVHEFEARTFSSDGGRFYAYRTLGVACDKVRDGAPDQPGTVIGCPIALYIDLVIWSALISRSLGWPVALPMLWTIDPAPFLLVSLGTPPVQALRFLVDSTTDSVRYWPLTTSHEGAIASAREVLEPIADWDKAGETLEGLFQRIASLGR
jgi:type VI secretion system protein ImpM